MLRSIQLPRPFSRAGGHAFIAKIPEQFLPALHSSSVGIVAEDGKMLGPAGTVHQQIRDEGRGAFSVWGTDVYLSASDNSDCESNARAYSLIVVDLSEPSLRDELARNDDFLLDLLHRNGNHSSSLVSNFFGYYKSLHGVLQRNGLPLPRRVMEIGSGKYPYTALRFLAAGVELFVANDVKRIERRLPAGFVQKLIRFLDLVDSQSAERLRARMQAPAGAAELVPGLEFVDERPFETVDGPRELDLVFSVSVLEHVQKPREVVARMFELLRPGGHAWHSIDLRDHRDFGRPLDFLCMTEVEYATIDTENRMRASDWDVVFAEAGFELVEQQFSTIPAGSQQANNADLVHTSKRPTAPWVDATRRAGFKHPFDTKDLVDLSVLGVKSLYRKP